jgi:hypothetical protein
MAQKKESYVSQCIMSYDQNDFLSRILNFDHLVDMIENKKLKFPRIASWDDTYENLLFKSDITMGGEKFGNIFRNFDFENKYFGLCWSYWEETDALWRIYSPQTDRVKIKVKIGNLYDSIFNTYDIEDDSSILPAFGRIVYVKKENLNTIFSHEMFMDINLFMTYNNLFLKRMEFEYENEFRTILVSLDSLPKVDLLEVPIDPLVLIEEIVFDPRISDELFDKYSAKLEKLGITNFKKSELYNPVDIKFNYSVSTISDLPLKVINYFDRSNSLRLCSDKQFKGLMTDTIKQMKSKL